MINKAVDKDSLAAFLWKDKEASTPLIKKKTAAPPSTADSPRTFVPASLGDAVTSPPKTPAPAALASVSALDDTEPVRLGSPDGQTKAPSLVLKPRIIYTTPTKVTTGRDTSARIAAKSVLPICANHNIWTKPSLEAMAGMSEVELSRVEHFQIGHYGVGSVTWPGVSDVRFLNIDEIIVFQKGSVTLFPDEELKPPQGTGLNKTAVIELLVKPKNVELAKKYEARYVGEMKKLTESNGAQFLSYDLETWRFRVEHFSTWGIDAMQWERIDLTHTVPVRNDLSLFSRIERELGMEVDTEEEESEYSDSEQESQLDDESLVAAEKSVFVDLVGALAVAPPTRLELIAQGWDLRVCDLFLNQSFRVALDQTQACWFPDHPVIFNQHKVNRVTHFSGEISASDQSLLDVLVANRNLEADELLDRILATNQSKSAFTLLQALITGGAEQSGAESINSESFNQWLSQTNAEAMRENPALSFSASAALATRDYAPSASSLLIGSGNPRLALAAAAALDETARVLMRDQLGTVVANDPTTQEVYDILGGKCDKLNHMDWRAQLALRYWFCEGNLTGFEPPSHSVEWRLIRSVVLNNPVDLINLISDAHGNGAQLILVFVILVILRKRSPSLIPDHRFHHVVKAFADYVLSTPEMDYQWAPILLSFLPESVQRDNLIFDVVSRNIDKDCSKIEELGGILTRDKLIAAKAMREIYHRNVDAAKDLLVRNGLSKMATAIMNGIPKHANDD